MNVGNVLIASFQITASSTNVPTSAGDPLELEDAMPSDIKEIEVISDLGGPVELLLGPNSNLDRLMIVAGKASTLVHHQRQFASISKNARLSIRNLAAAAISTGTCTINLWG